MPKVTVNIDLCKGCGMCVNACPKKIMALNKEVTNNKGYHPAHNTNESECTGCGSCAIMCPDVAIKVEV